MSGPESMVTLQERMVNLINQLSMPVLETSMAVSYTHLRAHET